MMSRELILLSPYRLPTHHTLMLNADEVETLLNGYLVLWHPAALRGATAPPRLASPYDYEQPVGGHVYAVPETPPLFLPEDWEQRVAQAGAKFFRVTANREETLANLLAAVGAAAGDPARAAPFYGIGLGYLVLDALFEAMDHLNQLALTDFWQDVTRAVEATDAEPCQQALEAAAHRLREAREIVYPNNVFLVDLALLDELPPDGPLPSALDTGGAINLLASVSWLERLATANPPALERIRAGVQAEWVEVCSGPYEDRDDALLPVESQLWNLRHGLETYRALLGRDLTVYGRRRFAASPQLPAFLHACGLTRAVLLPFDEGVLPQFRAAVIEWPSPDGKRVEAFTKTPLPAESTLTCFHLAHHLSRSMLHDTTAALALLHAGQPESAWYRDWRTLHRLAPVFGAWVTLSRFFAEVLVGEYPPPASPDDFHSDYLHQLTSAGQPEPVTRFSQHTRRRRHLEAAWTLAGLHRSVIRPGGGPPFGERLARVEQALELGKGETTATVSQVIEECGSALAERLLAKAPAGTPGFLVFNPCNFTRRVALELPGVRTPLPAPAKASQVAGEKALAVIEVPGLGFAWVPRSITPGTKVPMPRIKLAEERFVRNEFFEAEVDAASGGLRVFRDQNGRANRIGQQLVYGPGSEMRVKEIKVTSSGPALGEIVSEGAILDGHQNVLATYRQRLRAWWGRPLLEMRIELYPTEPPVGYPWHAYYGARFAWRDVSAPIFRGVNLTNWLTTHTRPETPEFLEVRSGSARTAILTGGLPFHQRHSQRMVDILLLPEGETARVFELALGLDLDEPNQAALDFITPPLVVPVANGPPHVGTSGWLFHVDASNLALTTLRPAADGADAVVARLVECRGVATPAELRCARNPVRAVQVDERDHVLGELPVVGDAVTLHFAAHEMQRVRVEFA
jgi:hypothetical protein